MKYAIRIALLVIIVLLAYLSYDTVNSDIRYAAEVEVKEEAVIEKLKIIKAGQMAYKEEYGKFSGNFDELLDFMQNGQRKIIIQSGSADDSTTVVTRTETMVSVKETLFADVNVPKLRYLPFHADSVEFKIAAGEINKNNVTVPVFQVTDQKPFSRDRKEKNNPLKVGSIYDVNYNGNWN